jgi:hypothetical protein
VTDSSPRPALQLIEIEFPEADIGKIPTACPNGLSQEIDGVSNIVHWPAIRRVMRSHRVAHET